MENISIEKVKSPIRKHMPWLTIVAVVCILTGAVADMVASIEEAEKMWWGGALCYFVGNVVMFFVVAAFLRAVHDMAGRSLLPMRIFTVTAVVYCLTSFIVNSTELYTQEIENYSIWGNLIIALYGISLLMYYAMFIVMWIRLHHRFEGELYLVGKWGLASVWTALALVGGCIVAALIGLALGEEVMYLILGMFTCVAIVGVVVCLCLSLRAMMRAIEQSETSFNNLSIKILYNKKMWYTVGGVVFIAAVVSVVILCVDGDDKEINEVYYYDYDSGFVVDGEEKTESPFGINVELEERIKHDYNCYCGIVHFCDRMSEIIDDAYAGESLFDWSQLPEDEQLYTSNDLDTTTYKRLQHIDRKTYKRLKSYFDSKDNISPLFELLPDFCAASDGYLFESDAGFTEVEYGNMIVIHFLDKKYNPEWLKLFEMNMQQYLEDIDITYFDEKSDNVYEVEFSTSPHIRYTIDYSGEKIDIKCY